MSKKKLCPVCGQKETLAGRTKDGRVYATCGDAFWLHTDSIGRSSWKTYRQRDKMEKLEEYMRIAQDIKKDFALFKDTGEWAWFDRDERDNPTAYHGGFKTFFAALTDAVQPYI